jgi:hypothetical protein
MPLSADFQFSQASLQDYVECHRRFQLRYLWELSWPAVEAEPIEEYEAHAADGEAFHRLIHQHQLGFPVERLEEMARAASQEEDDGQLLAWWRSYLAAGPAGLPAKRYPEIVLSAPLGEQRVLAKYDLIAIEPGRRAIIVDWKTSQNRPSQPWLAARLQTRVYRYVLAQAGSHLNGGQPLRPDQISMLYWFANDPDHPERLAYDETQLRADERFLRSLAAEIASAGEDDFPKTEDVRRCRFCPYRSLCDRGVEAGDMAELQSAEDEPETERAALDELDFDQVGEIAF